MNSREVELMLLRTRHLRKDAAHRKPQPMDEEPPVVFEVPSLDHLVNTPASGSLSMGLEL